MINNVFEQFDKTALKEYHHYWDGLTVRNNADYFRRWLFAFCSVHTTWEGNVRGYEAIKDLAWLGNDNMLRDRLYISGTGLHNNRAKFIGKFAEQFWNDPDEFWKPAHLPWRAFRDILEQQICGLGLAKTSFALELAFPTEAKLACLDVHMLRLYGINQARVKQVDYWRTELDWVDRSRVIGVEPYVARMVYWDGLQGKNGSRYWSHCLENS